MRLQRFDLPAPSPLDSISMRWWGLNGQTCVKGSVSVEGQSSDPDELGMGAAIGPREWFIFGKMMVINRASGCAWFGVGGEAYLQF